MHQSLLTVAIIGYVAATGLALAYLVQREELLHRLALLATLSAWVVHTVALLALAIDLGRPPLASMPEAVSVAVWVVVLPRDVDRAALRSLGLGAFVLPVALLFSLQSTPTPHADRPDVERRMALGAHRAGARGHRGARAQLRRRGDVSAAGASAQSQAPPRDLLLLASVAGHARSADVSHPGARISVPDDRLDPGVFSGPERPGAASSPSIRWRCRPTWPGPCTPRRSPDAPRAGMDGARRISPSSGSPSSC